MDATLIQTHKRDALFCYKNFKAYPPLNCWWAEHAVPKRSPAASAISPACGSTPLGPPVARDNQGENRATIRMRKAPGMG
jgi:hypothetical protein